MAMTSKVDFALKLDQLRGMIKRDPDAYKEEFDMQKRRFENELEIFKLRPTVDNERFTDLVTFMSHVLMCYKKQCENVPTEMMKLLEENANNLHPDVRAKLVSACIHMRNKSLIDPIVLLKLSFKLMAVQDKTMRTTLGEFVFNDIKTINLNKTNEKLNKRVQAMMYSLIEEDTSVIARKAVLILSELYRRRVWVDVRTVNVLGAACTSPSIQIAVIAINFFLGIEMKMNEDEDQEVREVTKKKHEVNKHEHSKKTKKRSRLVEKQTERNKKLTREQEKKAAESVPLFPAIQLLHDPQGLAEKLFQRARNNNERFEVRLLVMNFVSRLIGCHKLVLLSFYSYLQRYLTSHQQDVTKVLAYIVQAVHDLVPPEDLIPVIKTIAHNFVTERCTNEQMTVGLNAIREILSRAPAILLETGLEELVQDLAMYGKKQHKSVMVAAHGIINLVRATHPKLLNRKDRGKFHNPNATPATFGETHVATGVAGADLLDAYERGDILISTGGEVMWKEDLEADAAEGIVNSDDEGWVNVGGSDGSDEEGEEDPDEAPQLVPVEEEEEEEDEDEDGWEEVGSGDDDSGDEDDWEEVEGSDDDDNDDEEEEGEWEMMDQDGEEEDAETEALASPSSSAPPNSSSGKKNSKDVRESVAAKRILTDADFELIRKLQEAHSERIKDPRYRSRRANLKREREEDGDSDSEEGKEEGVVPKQRARDSDDDEDLLDEDGNEKWQPEAYQITAADLGAGIKTDKANKLERLQSVLSGREDVKFAHEGHRGGLTNLEKRRKKNYVMVRKGKRDVTGKLSLSNSVARYQKMNTKKITGRDKRKRRRT
jgi:protein SDA1